MRKFASGLSRDLIVEIKTALMIKDMDILRLVIHKQHVEDEKRNRCSLEIGRVRGANFLIREVLSRKVVGIG